MAAFCHPFLFLLLSFTGVSAGSQSDVKCTTSNPAVLGGKVTLTCEFKSLYLDIEQLTWQKDKDNVLQNIATQSKKYGVKINPSCNQRVSVTGTELNRSSITISDLKLEDETLYICIFNAFPFGAFKGKVYLPVSAIQQQIQKEDDTAAIQQQIQKDDDTAAVLNEVICSYSRPKLLDIKLQPGEHHCDPMVTENTDGHITSVHNFKAEDLHKKTSCVFLLQLPSVKPREAIDAPSSLSSNEPKDIFVLSCSVSGKTPKIIWENGGDPIFQEETVSRNGGFVNLTSVRRYLVNSLLAQKTKVICNVVSEDTDEGMVDFHRRLPIMSIVSVIVPLLCVVVGFLYCQKKHVKSTQAVTPMKSSDPENIEFRTPPRSNYKSIPGSSTSKRKSRVARNDDVSLSQKSLFPSQALEPYFSLEC